MAPAAPNMAPPTPKSRPRRRPQPLEPSYNTASVPFPSIATPQVPQFYDGRPPSHHPRLPSIAMNTPLPLSQMNGTRPHPHVSVNGFYINSVPPDLPEHHIVEALGSCLPVRIKLPPTTVPEHLRLLPNAHYDWMPRNGIIDYQDLEYDRAMYNTEKALIILGAHPFFAQLGIWVSPYPPPADLPVSDTFTPARYINPSRLTAPPPAGSAKDMVQILCPNPAELFDAVRPWGSVRLISSWVHGAAFEQGDPHAQFLPPWSARIEFCYEDEAKRFDVGFAQSGVMIKDWTVTTTIEAVSIPVQPDPIPMLPLPPHQHLLPAPDHVMWPMSSFDSSMMAGLDQAMFAYNHAGPSMPITPNSLIHTPPWAHHNVFSQLPDGYKIPDGAPSTPTSAASHHRNSSLQLSTMGYRHKNWQVTLESSPEGDVRPTGFWADDGTFILHGPGQHIRPAPQSGPGSTSASGLVDYSNIFVKNLDGDITSYTLEEVFSDFGPIVSARIMRDSEGRSRGYGFVSFHNPEHALQAIRVRNGSKLGTRIISVTLHEPKKLRPDKIAERVALGQSPVAPKRQGATIHRRSMSPLRGDKVRSYDTEPSLPGATDNIRLLSPENRKKALALRVSTAVNSFARNDVAAKPFVDQIVQTLVRDDLSLIPLLHDRQRLDEKITEIFEMLQSATEEIQAVGRSQSQPPESDVARIEQEFEKIDPLNSSKIISFMRANPDSETWQHAMGSPTDVAYAYGLIKQQMERDPEYGWTEVGQLPLSATRKNANDTVDLDTSQEPTAVGADTVTAEEEEDSKLDISDIDALASLPADRILKQISGNEGQALLSRLGISNPTAIDSSRMSAWLVKTVNKEVVERKADIANMIARKLDTTLKRSEKVRVVRDLVNAEDDDAALCQLILYPALLNSKVKSFIQIKE